MLSLVTLPMQALGHRSLAPAKEVRYPLGYPQGIPPQFLDLPPAQQQNNWEEFRFPFPVFPKGGQLSSPTTSFTAQWEGGPHAARGGRLPLTRGFSTRFPENPLVIPRKTGIKQRAWLAWCGFSVTIPEAHARIN